MAESDANGRPNQMRTVAELDAHGWPNVMRMGGRIACEYSLLL